MRVMGRILFVLGILGVGACVYGVSETKLVKGNLTEGTSTLLPQARGLLRAMDAKLRAPGLIPREKQDSRCP
jgi:hypothetical protein